MTQTIALGSQAASVAAAVEALQQQQFLRRLWDRDASLWSADAAVQAAIRNRLGWLRIAEVMALQAASIQTCAREVREAGFTHVLLLGMGGSGLFSEVCAQTFGAAPGHPRLTVLDTTDPTWVARAERQCPLQQLLVIISSKSGGTSEIAALSRYFYERFKTIDANPGSHCLVITDAGTSLEQQARDWRCRRVFVHGPDSGADVGGRFSALTFFGLVPSALMGVDIAQLLERAQQMYRLCGPQVPMRDPSTRATAFPRLRSGQADRGLAQDSAPRALPVGLHNPAVALGAALGVLARQGRDKMTLLCSPELASFGTWVEQLIAENLGKQGKGIVPVFNEPRRAPAAYGSDRVFVELQLADQLDVPLREHARALAQAGHPVISIQWQDRYDLGGEVAKWSVASAVTGALLQINPFDEPNVKESKDRTKALLAAYTATKRLPEVPPDDLAAVERLLSTVAPADYLAVLSFLPRTEALDRRVVEVREALSRRFPNATVLGFGPRYLHSTGQLFKGGPATGLFLLLTGEDPIDVPIPGEPFGFSVLKQAQALGDLQAMQERGRRVVRLHLRGDLDRATKQLIKTLKERVSQK